MNKKLIYWRRKGEEGRQFWEGYLTRRVGPLVAIQDREYSKANFFRESELEIVEVEEKEE